MGVGREGDSVGVGTGEGAWHQRSHTNHGGGECKVCGSLKVCLHYKGISLNSHSQNL